jgi:hypothetical protein
MGSLVGWLLFGLLATAVWLIVFHAAAALWQITRHGWHTYARFNRWLRQEERIP